MSERPHPSDAFPKAPTAADWERLTPAERQHVIDTLPNEVTDAELSPPEGDLHFQGKLGPLDALTTVYRRTIPQGGYYRSQALGLDLGIVDGRLRFFIDGAILPEAAEQIARLERMTAELELRRDEEAARARAESERASAESERASAEAERANRAEQRLADLEAELARLKGKR